MRLTRALVPGMKQRGWGRVIHISSIMALGSTPTRNAYSATKAALIGLAKASALDLGHVRHYRQLHRTGTDRHRNAHVDLEQGTTGQPGGQDRRGAVGQPDELIGSRPAAGERRWQLYHRHLPGCRRRRALPRVLSF